MKQYLDLLRDVLENGTEKKDRTGTGTRSVFGRQMRFDLSKGFPLITTKKIFIKGVIHELLWIISGSTNIKYLKDNGVKIWDEWADKDGNLGPIYGKQWRDFGGYLGEYGDSKVGVDQLANLIKDIKSTPESRRLIISAWNPEDIPNSKLPPCHSFMQFNVTNRKLSCQLYQRSGDMFLGVPFNIASYALLTRMIAQVTDLQVGEFIHTLGDAHIYLNHLDQVKEQLSREPRSLPQIKLNPAIVSIDDFKYDDFALTGYDPYPVIKGEVSI